MKAALLSVGTELLFGQITNTNTVYLSRKLNAIGIDVLYHHTVGDNPGRLKEVIETSFNDCDLVITTGGLGPTQDDMTKEIACQVMDDYLVMHDDILEYIRNQMLAYKSVMTENNIKQAKMPSRSRIFYNDAGTAPGFALSRKNISGTQWIACLPGPPKEMKRMFEKSVQSWIEEFVNGCLVYKEIRTFGIGESDVETLLMPVIEGQTDPTVATYANNGETSIRIASKRSTKQEAEYAVSEMIENIKTLIGQYIYSCDGQGYPQVVGEMLMKKRLTISAAESCTGGSFASSLSDIAGISAVFDRSIVTYSNKAKIEELGVNPLTLAEHGAVSEETALEMAEGIKRVSGTDIGISVTGIAGPDGGTKEKPVGLIYIGFAFGKKLCCRKISRSINDRQRNRNYAVLSMFDLIYRNLIDKD